MKRFFALILSAALLLGGCTVNQPESTTPSQQNPSQGGSYVPDSAAGEPVKPDFAKTDEEMLAGTEYVLPPGTPQFSVACSGSAITADTDTVACKDGIVTVTGQATYQFSGDLTGMVVVDAGKEDTVQLILSGVRIHSQTSAAIYVRKAARVIVILAEETENVLSNGGSFQSVDESAIDGAVFSKKDLAFTGSGSLKIDSPAGHGIVCKDNLLIAEGSYTITSAGHGLDANDSIRIGNAALTIDAGKDGIHAENADDASLGFVYLSGSSMKVEAEGDGISAGAWLQLEDGSYQLLCGGGSENGTKADSGSYGDFMGGGFGGPGGPGGHRSADTQTDSTSMKGVKAGASLLINGGTIDIDSADDAIHADVSLVINSGSFTIASGDDALHAEEVLTITNCDMTVSESYEALEAHKVYITGGKIHAVSTDDGINAAGGNDASGTGGRDEKFGGMGRPGGNSDGVVEISGGSVYLNASGDGIDSNGSLTITGGYTVVCGPTRGDTAVLDYDTAATIDGGTFIGTGAVMMAQTLTSNSDQGVVAAYSQGGFRAGTELTLTDENGKQVLSYTPELDFQLIILSTPDMVSGASYVLTAGQATATVTAE